MSEESKQIAAYLRARADEQAQVMLRNGATDDAHLWRSRIQELARDVEQGFHQP